MLAGKHILLIIGGGIAAYKSLELIRRYQDAGASVTPVLTRAAEQFVTPLSVSALAGRKVYRDLFDLTDEAEMGHIQLSRAADLVVVAPATADLIAKMATGRADDLASTALLATDKPVLIAPAMNVRMWQHPATQRNVTRLEQDGVLQVGPNEGAMACKEFGPGRMAEPAEILASISAALASPNQSLAGKKILVTSGPTHEPIDPVRFIANRSSGKQGHAIAAAAQEAGAEVVLISGPVRLADPDGVTTLHVETAAEMLDTLQSELPADVLVMAAAVADWRVEQINENKTKKQKGAGPAPLKLRENPDILATIGNSSDRRPQLVIGFAAETENLLENADAKLKSKGADWIVANDVSPANNVFGGDQNTVKILSRSGVDSLPKLTKAAVATTLVERMSAFFKGPGTQEPS